MARSWKVQSNKMNISKKKNIKIAKQYFVAAVDDLDCCAMMTADSEPDAISEFINNWLGDEMSDHDGAEFYVIPESVMIDHKRTLHHNTAFSVTR